MTDEQREELAALRECPFCGGPAGVDTLGGRGWLIECLAAGCVNPHVSYTHRPDAFAAWNRRAALRSPASEGRTFEEWDDSHICKQGGDMGECMCTDLAFAAGQSQRPTDEPKDGELRVLVEARAKAADVRAIQAEKGVYAEGAFLAAMQLVDMLTREVLSRSVEQKEVESEEESALSWLSEIVREGNGMVFLAMTEGGDIGLYRDTGAGENEKSIGTDDEAIGAITRAYERSRSSSTSSAGPADTSTDRGGEK